MYVKQKTLLSKRLKRLTVTASL